MTPIIEVLLSEKGDVTYRLHACRLDTRMYGEIFATLVRQVATMMESEGGFARAAVISQIFEAFLREMEAPTAEVETKMLQ